ncbi:MAG: RNA-binding S4 domain-containing protein [Hyphomicrobiaceae bacterium]
MRALPEKLEPGDNSSSQQTQRLDKWLWFARVAKTRTLASALVAAGKIRVNKAKATKPSQLIRAGDVITATVARRVRILRVCQLGVRRGPATEALTLYEDLTPAPVPPMSKGRGRANVSIVDRPPVTAAALREPGSGRPTKRERRLTDRLRKSINDQ